MSASADIPADTLRKQRLAADPAGSAWVSANAGSGKTFVLTQRVVRLLLGGVEPGRILCLTFTKAAAANMAIKIFAILARWVALDDAALRAEIVATGAAAPRPAELAAARRLFARTVETPGGLKILTIHAFCEKLLHAFPFEANVAAGFSVIEALRQEDLMGRAREAVLAEAAARPGTAVATALAALARDVSATDFAALMRDVDGHRAELHETVTAAGGLDGMAEALAAALGTGGRSVAAIEQAMLQDGIPPSEWDAVGRHLAHRGGGKGQTADRLIAAAAAPAVGRLDAYLDVYLTQELEPRAAGYLPKPLRSAEPGLCARLDRERDRLVGLLGLRRAAAAHERTMALLTVAEAVLGRYALLKRRAGLLDFDDLIERTRLLVTRSHSAWILYKLDKGIDHMLVDEAQDTSPDQWAILQALAGDFFAGEGAREVERTFFAVGDEKQSIYSFQGARPAMVAKVRDDFARRAAGAGRRFESIDLLLSFRSVKTVLDVVDRVFAHGGNARGLTAGREAPPPHQALKAQLPGLVEIWPAIGPAPVLEPSDWRLPLDVPEAGSPPVIVARRVAERIAAMTAPGSGDSVDAGGRDGGRRPVRPGDVMILVRSRNAIFDAVIRALKERGVPVAGADRLDLTAHIAVMDLMAAGRAALLPDDDLTLASLLKSPLIGLDDDDLIRLAPGRAGSLDAALRASPLDRDRQAAGRIAVWRDRAATLTPFAFYMRLLGEDGGRRQLLSRLGPEAADVVDEFVALALAHERDGAPSLLAFLARLETADRSIKRDLEAAADAVRVMTVHAAKGLEAKVVFLPDTCSAPNGRHDARLFRLDGGSGAPLLAWSPRMDADPEMVAARRQTERDAALEEHRRLLYVALTRAEERLYIAGYHAQAGPAPDSWYDMIIAADLGPKETVPAPWGGDDTVLRRADGTAEPATASGSPPRPAPTVLPPWIGRPPRPRRPLPRRSGRPTRWARRTVPIGRTARPSRPSAPRRAAALAGRLAHQLLQHLPPLPPARRHDAAGRFLARHGGRLDAEARATLTEEVQAVLDDPALAALFGAGSRAEVALAATIDRPGAAPIAVTGQIDRMAVTDDAVLIADFKSGRPRPLGETPPSYITQLALYAAAVGRSIPASPCAPAWSGPPARASSPSTPRPCRRRSTLFPWTIGRRSRGTPLRL